MRTVGSQFERALIAGKPGDNRALLHIDYVDSELRPYLDKGFPEIVDMIGPAEAAQAGYEVTYGYSYLLIFKLGDTIQGTQGIERGAQEEAILQWDGNQFKKIGPPKRNEPKPGVWKEL